MRSERSVVIRLLITSFFSGMFISCYISYISSLFLRTAGADALPLAFIAAGLGGGMLTGLFNRFENRFGFERLAPLFLGFVSLTVLVVWYGCNNYKEVPGVVFFSYAWFWSCGNFVLLIFWRLPGMYFNLEQHKRLNGIISSGEVVAAILSYLSVPLLIQQSIIQKESTLLLISFASILLMTSMVIFSGYKHVVQVQGTSTRVKVSIQDLLKLPLFKYLFLAVAIAVAIQSVIDYSLMLVVGEVFSGTRSLTAFFGTLFGSAKVFELLMKTTVASSLFRQFGILSGLLVFGLVLGLTSIVGLVSHASGVMNLLFLASLMNKMMERSLARSMFSPSIHFLFQMFPDSLRSSVQNLGDGQGKNYGQWISGILLVLISLIHSFSLKINFLLVFLLICILAILFLAKIILPRYREVLQEKMLSGNNLAAKEKVRMEQVTLKEKPSISTLFSPETYTKGKQNFTMLPYEALELQLSVELPGIRSQRYIDSRTHVAMDTLLEIFYSKIDQDKLTNYWHHLRSYDKETLQVVLNSLHELPLKRMEKEGFYIELLREKVQETAIYISLYASLSQYGNVSLNQCLHAEIASNKELLFQILAFANDGETMQLVAKLFRSQAADDWVMAQEMLDILLTDEEKSLILPLVQHRKIESSLRKAEKVVPIYTFDPSEALRHIIWGSPMEIEMATRICALHMAMSKSQLSMPQLASLCQLPEKILAREAMLYLEHQDPRIAQEIRSRMPKAIGQVSESKSAYPVIQQLLAWKIPIRQISLLLNCLQLNEDQGSKIQIYHPEIFSLLCMHYPSIEEASRRILVPSEGNLIPT